MKKKDSKNLLSRTKATNLLKIGNPRLIETIKFNNGHLENIKYHNDRFNSSRSDLFGITKKLKLEKEVSIPENLGKGIYKCRITYSLQIDKVVFEPYIPKKIESLKLIECNEINYNYKYAERSAINTLYEKRGTCDDILIIKNGCLTDTSYANIALWDGKKWCTPSFPLLRGTTLLRMLHEKLIYEQEIKPEQIKSFEKIRIFNSMMDFEAPLKEFKIFE